MRPDSALLPTRCPPSVISIITTTTTINNNLLPPRPVANADSPHNQRMAIDSPCECEHNDPDSLDARLFSSVVLAVAPAVIMDDASSLSMVPSCFQGGNATRFGTSPDEIFTQCY